VESKKKVKLIETECKNVDASGWGKEGEAEVGKGYKLPAIK